MDCSDISGQRTRAETIVKSIATHAATLIVVGHLSSLRNISERNKRWYYDVIGFFFMPTLPAAQLLYYSFQSIRKKPSDGHYFGFLKYHLAVAFGFHVPTSFDLHTVPLVNVDRGDIYAEKGRRGRQWIGRTVVLLIFINQSISAFILYIRRLLHERADQLDHRNGLVALGGLFAGVVSLGITSMDLSWKYKPEKLPPVHKRDDFPSVDTSKEYILSGLLYVVWVFLSQGELFRVSLDYFPSPLTLYNSVVANGSNELIGATVLFAWVAYTTLLLAFPISFFLFSIPGSYNIAPLFWLSAGPVLCLNLSISLSKLLVWIFELQSFRCPTSPTNCEPSCWKDPWAEKLWTF